MQLLLSKDHNKAIKFVTATKQRGFHRAAYALLRQPFMAALCRFQI